MLIDFKAPNKSNQNLTASFTIRGDFHVTIYNFIFRALGRTSLSSAHVGLPCSNIPGLTRPQRNICLKHPDIMECISRGAHLGIAGCQEQMKDRRWNCATVETGTNVFGKVTDRSKATILKFHQYIFHFK